MTYRQGSEIDVTDDRLYQLAKENPEVRELLRDNYSLSISALNRKLDEDNRNHTAADAKLSDRMRHQEIRVDEAAKVVGELKKQIRLLQNRIEKLEGETQ